MSIARFGQNPFDIVIREAGRLEAIVDLVKYNQLTVDDSLEPGTVLTTTYTQKNDTVANYFTARGILPNNWDRVYKVWSTEGGDLWEDEDGNVWTWE